MFEACRQIPAHAAAQKLGLLLKQKNRRYWACCPLHGEGTPSMMFDEHGHWYCFGCKTGGDAVALYAAFFNEKPYQAAKHLAEDFGIIQSAFNPPKVTPKPLHQQLEGDDELERVRIYQFIKRHAAFVRERATGDMFWEALSIETDADVQLRNIEAGRTP